MPKLRFEQLLGLYRSIDFDPEGDQGSLNLVTAEQLTDLQIIESDDFAGEDANLSVIGDPSLLAVGQKVRVRVGPPRISLGLLARSVDDLLKTPEGRITEPAAYFVVDGRIDPETGPTPTTIAAYRKVLAVVALFAKLPPSSTGRGRSWCSFTKVRWSCRCATTSPRWIGYPRPRLMRCSKISRTTSTKTRSLPFSRTPSFRWSRLNQAPSASLTFWTISMP